MGQADSTILELVADFLATLQQSDIHLDEAYLYGSHAVGRARPDSDIDVALVSADFGDSLDDHRHIVDALLSNDARIETVRFRPEEFRDENPLVWEIKTKGIRLL
jgi:predicted nucleotidyltransferase